MLREPSLSKGERILTPSLRFCRTLLRLDHISETSPRRLEAPRLRYCKIKSVGPAKKAFVPQ
jgi:hypothetical protein